MFTGSDPTVTTTDPVAVAGRLRYSAFRLARLLRQQDDSGHAPALLTALAVVDREGPLTLGELAAQEQVSPPTITKVVDALEARGFVERVRDESDRRVCRVRSTDARAPSARGEPHAAHCVAREPAARARTRRSRTTRGRARRHRAAHQAAGAGVAVTSKIRGFSKETFSSLRYRNFRLFFIGQGISQVGNWLTLVAQTLLVLTLTNSGVAVGLLTACQFAPILLFGAFAGLIADRSDKRKLLIIVQFFAMAQSFVLAALAFMGDPPVLAIYAVAAMGGLAMAFDNPARRAFVVEMVPQADVNNAVSLNSAVMTSSRVIGPALAGLLIATVGYSWASRSTGSRTSR